jgi:hypothetical protein
MDILPKANKKSEVAQFYTNPNFEYGKSKYLARESKVLNSLLCCTLLPKIGNTDAIQEKYYVAIKSILDGTKVNWVDFLGGELMWSKHEVKGSLGYQPYIMALVKHMEALVGIERVRHKSFCPRSNDPVFSIEDMPQP